MNTTAIALQSLEEPQEVSSEPTRPAESDFWEFISGTVIQRFLDYY